MSHALTCPVVFLWYHLACFSIPTFPINWILYLMIFGFKLKHFWLECNIDDVLYFLFHHIRDSTGLTIGDGKMDYYFRMMIVWSFCYRVTFFSLQPESNLKYCNFGIIRMFSFIDHSPKDFNTLSLILNQYSEFMKLEFENFSMTPSTFITDIFL